MDTPIPDDAAASAPLPPPSLSPLPDAAAWAPPDLAGGYVPGASVPPPAAPVPAGAPAALPPAPVPPGYAASPYGAPGYPVAYQPYAYAPNPDGPAAGLRYAGFGVRTLAYLVDGILLLVLALIASIPMGGFIQDGTVTTTAFGTTRSVQLNPAVQLFSTLLGAIYFIGFWTAMGRTPGQRLLNLRVLRAADGQPIGIGQALVRYIGLLISFVVIGLGVIWVALDPRRQGWHDKMANTFVVQEVR